MVNARLIRSVIAVALAAALPAAAGAAAYARAGETGAGSVITNRAEATYTDASGTPYSAASAPVSVTVTAVAAVAVTPDETEPSAPVAPNERVERLFRLCNTGNTPDTHTVTSAGADAPAGVRSLHFDLDASGTLTDADREITIGETRGPLLAPGACAGVVLVVETNDARPGQRLAIRLTARTNAEGAAGAGAQDSGTILNDVGLGPRLSSPDDPQLPPVKLVEGRERVTASPGSALEYQISFRNSGETAARDVVLGDDLPGGLDYVAGTLRLGERALTDAEDADEGYARDRRIEVRLALVPAGSVVRVSFRARVGASAPHGTGLINTAVVAAGNAPAADTNAATAVTNPYGLVYRGRTSGAPVPGAVVTLLSEASGGAAVQLARGAGTEPNGDNANPFGADSQGRWSFALAPGQLGTRHAPARYFLNVTAVGYRARLIEVTVSPAPDGSGLFTLMARARDGQPVARAGGFELTESAVEIEGLAAFALNVPLFENTALGISKSADRPSAEVGDTISYRVELRNETPVAAETAEVRDVLPPSFRYAEGTGRAEVAHAGHSEIEPDILPDGTLVFRLGRIEAGGRAVVTYRARVGANAREGEQFNEARGGATLVSGERLDTPLARAGVRVRRGVFSSRQVIVGRVFDDANGNGLFDAGERGLAGVRLYLNNGESVVTDSAGLYNFPVVNEGSHVVALDPVTLPHGYALAGTGRREERSPTRLLRTPLGGGGLLRQNFALRSADGPDETDRAAAVPAAAGPPSGESEIGGGGAKENSQGRVPRDPEFGVRPTAFRKDQSPPQDQSASTRPTGAGGTPRVGDAGSVRPGVAGGSKPGTYELLTNETLEPPVAGEVRVVSPRDGDVAPGASLEVTAQVEASHTVEVEVAGQRVPDTKIGERRLDHRNRIATFTFVGISVAPGPNRVRVTAVGPNGARGRAVELSAYGRGPVRRVEIVTDRSEVSAGGRDSTIVRVRAFDQWGHPAADGSVAVQTSAGRLMMVGEEEGKVGAGAGRAAPGVPDPNRGAHAKEHAPDEARTEQVVPLTGGEGRVTLVSGSAPGAAVLRATTGAAEARGEVRFTPEARAPILVAHAELTLGAQQPEFTDQDDTAARGRLAFFYRGPVPGKGLLTLAYDSNRPLNRLGARDRLFQYDPLDRAYTLFGDSSTRADDAESNSKLYLRLDRGRSYFLFGDFETENREAGLASYTRKLTGVKLHVENSRGDYVSVTGARPDTAFARDVFPGGTFALARLSHGDVLPGSETVTIEVRDRRNPEVILSREQLVRSADYNLDAASGEIFFLRPVSAFDFSFNLVQVVVTYEHRADGRSSDVYTARAFKRFEGAGLELGLSLVNQRQGEFGSFLVGGVDAEKSLPRGGLLRAEWAASRGRVTFGGNLFGADSDERHDGQAFRAEVEQPLPFREARLRASFARAGEGFLNPFGQTVTPGSRRAEASVEMRPRPSSQVRLGFADERNKTANVDNGRRTLSASWAESFTDRLRATFGYDFRRFRDELAGRDTDSNLVTVGAEWRATDRLQFSFRREQNLTEADPTYPNQTTLAAAYRWNQFTRLFFTQRLASAPVVPISDAAATGFASTGARRETAVGVETKLGRLGNLNSRYQLENGINGADSFAVIGLSNRLPVCKALSLDLGYERGFHLAGRGASFNSGHVGFSWLPTEDFRAGGRYEVRDRGGSGSVLTLGAAGRLLDNLTSLARLQLARTSFGGRSNSSLDLSAAVAWRPLDSDRAGLLFSYTRRGLRREGSVGDARAGGETRDRSDTLSSDWYYQASHALELYGRLALRFGDTASPGRGRVSTLTYLTQGRASYRFARSFDAAAELRWLAQPASATRRASFGAELGYWVLQDLRLGGGYNWAGAAEPSGAGPGAGRRGFYFTASSKISGLFDLFGPRGGGKGGGGAKDAGSSGGGPE